METRLFFVGDRFYWQSGTIMSSLYEENTLHRYDWGYVQRDLGERLTVTIRPATSSEMIWAEERLNQYPHPNLSGEIGVSNSRETTDKPAKITSENIKTNGEFERPLPKDVTTSSLGDRQNVILGAIKIAREYIKSFYYYGATYPVPPRYEEVLKALDNAEQAAKTLVG